MKKLLAILLATAFLAFAAHAADPFEGQLTLKVTGSAGKSQQFNLSLKGNFTRMEMSASGMGGPGAVIMDSARHEATIIMPQQHMYMVQPIPRAGAAAGGPGASAPESPPAAESTFEKSGVTEKILGYDCVKYTTHDKNSTVELWMTDQLGPFNFLGFGAGAMGAGMRGGPRGGAGPVPPGWEQLLQGKEMFPLRIVSTGADGRVERIEIVSIDKQAVPDSTFAPPAGFQKIDLGNMMRGMGLPPGLRPPGGG